METKTYEQEIDDICKRIEDICKTHVMQNGKSYWDLDKYCHWRLNRLWEAVAILKESKQDRNCEDFDEAKNLILGI